MTGEQNSGGSRRRADRAQRGSGGGPSTAAIVVGVVVAAAVAGGVYLVFGGRAEPPPEAAPEIPPVSAPEVPEPEEKTPAPAAKAKGPAQVTPLAEKPAAAGPAKAAGTQTKRTGWCDITVPETAKVGEEVEVRVKVRGFGRKVFLHCDLKDTHHRMMKWGGPGRPLGDGEETVYRLKVSDRPGLEAVYAYLMAHADREGKKELANAATPQVKVTGAAELPKIAHNKSWIWVDPVCASRVMTEGDAWDVPVEYYLDEGERLGATKLNIWVAGPWIDCPDGKYTKKRYHESYGGLSGRIDAKPGRHRHVFQFRMPKAKERNSLLVICNFIDPSGKRWPWEVRQGGPWFRRRGGYFELDTDRPGNMFLYEQPVRVFAELKNVMNAGAQKTLRYGVFDTDGKKIAAGDVRFTVKANGQKIDIPLRFDRRGTFLIEAEVDGWEKRHTTFCRIPDVQAVTKGARTKFGLSNILRPGAPERIEELCRIAQMLGLTACRNWCAWRSIEPGRGVFKLDAWEKPFELAAKYGIDSWLLIEKPPAWALEERAKNVGYSGFRCKLDAWEECIRTVTTRFKGKFYGWEWLNEIVPGGAETAVEDYVDLCRIGTKTAKAIDPGLKTMMAGGLWPRSFRKELLAAGLARHVDILPVHYSNGGGIAEAREDLDAVGATGVAVWDDESARGLSTWNMPPIEQLAITRQSQWVLSQWPDELIAGCERIIYFGGGGSAAGNWTYLMDDLSPRPVAATVAVLVSKLAGAEPVGVFSLGSGGVFHLFDGKGEDGKGKAVLLASSHAVGEKIDLNVGGVRRLTLTDHQGNERRLPAAGGTAQLALSAMPYFVEGADLDVLKAYVVPAVQSHRAALKRSKLSSAPRVTALRGKDGGLFVRLANLYGRRLSGSFRIETPPEWNITAEKSFSLAPGEVKVVPVPVAIPAAAEAKDYPLHAAFSFGWKKLPKITKPFVLSVISAEMLGNLFPNGGLETADAGDQNPEGWKVNATTKSWVSSEGLGLGLGRRVLKFTDTKGNWEHCGRTIELRGGHTYLYTAWVWNKDMFAGSNIYQNLAAGEARPLYTNQVFNCGDNNPYWQVYTCRYRAPEAIKSVGFVPVVKGNGRAYYDNIRVTMFEGTDFAAESYRTPAVPKIDGKLDDWIRKCPLPLVGKNQLSVRQDAYRWSPENLNAVGYLMWDDRNLYVAMEVRDDVHCARTTGERTSEGDGLVLAFDPTNRAPNSEAKAFAYYISSASPGGGSGRYTIYRPPKRSAGLSSGQLIKDSSVYDMAVVRGRGTCVYEIRMPFAELGGIEPGLGRKFAFSIQLNDNDGAGLVAHMNWGGGISPKWEPARFGVVTLVE